MIKPSKKNEVAYILNEKNKLITPDFINNLLMKYDIDYKIKNIEYFITAMTHVSYLIRDNSCKTSKNKQFSQQIGNVDPIKDATAAIPLRTQSYERLEFLGDSIIHAFLASYLYERYDKEQEGFMTKLRTLIENGNTLSSFSQVLGLNEYLLISRYIESIGARENNYHIMEDSFEAFIGALYKDAGFELGYGICYKLLIKIIEMNVDFSELLSNENNFKDRLLQYFHTKRWCDPVYGSLNVSGPENSKQYLMYVKLVKHPRDEGTVVGKGTGASKKKGEQEAAKQALIYFGEHTEKENEEEDDNSVCEDYQSDSE